MKMLRYRVVIISLILGAERNKLLPLGGHVQWVRSLQLSE